MKVFTTCAEICSWLDSHGKGEVGFVPTMGALHEGHVSLVERCIRECDVTVVSIFVNPTQFNDPNDLRNYPRTLEADLEKLDSTGVDVVFAPSQEQIYPHPDTRVFDFGRLDKVMEGATRPGHFNGVAQVVSRLFEIVNPTKAYFGQKDFQQIAIIKAMIQQLGIRVQIVECPIIREPDGLAMSSRNALLSPEVRAAAPIIHASMAIVAQRRRATPAEAEDAVTQLIEKNLHLRVIYMNIVDPHTLERIASWTDCANPRGCIAVQAGSVRLIDNIEF